VGFIRLVAALIGCVFGFFLGSSLLQVTQVTPLTNQILVVLLLATACAILQNTWQCQDERTGRMPHIIRGGEPLVYDSSDGTLWALLRLFEYTTRSGDQSLLRDKMPMVEHFFEASMNFVQRGLLPSGGIIDRAYLWETWEDTPYTPRDGYPVEIELLWLTVLSRFGPVVRESNAALADQMERVLWEGTETFRLFEHDGYLVDSRLYDWQQRRILTPNGYIAFGLEYPLPDDLVRSMVMLGRDQLAGHRGIRSLAPRDWPSVLPATFLADPHNVQGKDMRSVGIFNYHRGIEWEWLNPFFVARRLEHSQHPFQALTVGREESLDGSHRTPLGVPLGERLQLLDKPLRFREAALDFLSQGHRILRRAAPRTSASA